MAGHETSVEVLGSWSQETSKAFWEGFTPAASLQTPARG